MSKVSNKKGFEKVSPLCCVCQEAGGRYKCPKCRLPYCSVSCCRTHKEACGQQQLQAESDIDIKSSTTSPSTSAIVCPPPTIANDSSSNCSGSNDLDIITDLQKQQLANCKEVRDMLKSKRMRDKIAEIDGAGGARRDVLKKARSNPEFEGFVDLMLRTAKYKQEQ
jgi:zinc finger HIT domain-containing protein 3